MSNQDNRNKNSEEILEERMYHVDDSKLDILVNRGRDARRNSNLQGCIDNFEKAISYLQSLKGKTDDVDMQLRMGLVYQELGRYYKEDDLLEEAIEAKELGVNSLEFVASRVQDPSELHQEIARDYLTIANIKYQLRQDDTPEFKKALKYLWPLFKKGSLTNQGDYASLNRILIFLGKRFKGEERIENLKQQLEFYQHIKTNRINVSNIHTSVDFNIKKVQTILAKIEQGSPILS